MAITAIWTIVILTVVSGAHFAATRRWLLTRSDLFLVFFTVFISSPLMAHGFRDMMLSRAVGIPFSRSRRSVKSCGPVRPI